MTSKRKAIDFEDNRFARVTKVVLMDRKYLDKPIQKLVYAMLCNYANNKTKKSHPAVKTIAEDCLCSPNTVRAALKKLKELDLIDVRERKTSNGHTSNEYTLWEPPAHFFESRTSENDSAGIQSETVPYPTE